LDQQQALDRGTTIRTFFKTDLLQGSAISDPRRPELVPIPDVLTAANEVPAKEVIPSFNTDWLTAGDLLDAAAHPDTDSHSPIVLIPFQNNQPLGDLNLGQLEDSFTILDLEKYDSPTNNQENLVKNFLAGVNIEDLGNLEAALDQQFTLISDRANITVSGVGPNMQLVTQLSRPETKGGETSDVQMVKSASVDGLPRNITQSVTISGNGNITLNIDRPKHSSKTTIQSTEITPGGMNENSIVVQNTPNMPEGMTNSILNTPTKQLQMMEEKAKGSQEELIAFIQNLMAKANQDQEQLSKGVSSRPPFIRPDLPLQSSPFFGALPSPSVSAMEEPQQWTSSQETSPFFALPPSSESTTTTPRPWNAGLQTNSYFILSPSLAPAFTAPPSLSSTTTEPSSDPYSIASGSQSLWPDRPSLGPQLASQSEPEPAVAPPPLRPASGPQPLRPGLAPELFLPSSRPEYGSAQDIWSQRFGPASEQLPFRPGSAQDQSLRIASPTPSFGLPSSWVSSTEASTVTIPLSSSPPVVPTGPTFSPIPFDPFPQISLTDFVSPDSLSEALLKQKEILASTEAPQDSPPILPFRTTLRTTTTTTTPATTTTTTTTTEGTPETIITKLLSEAAAPLAGLSAATLAYSAAAMLPVWLPAALGRKKRSTREEKEWMQQSRILRFLQRQ